MLMHFNIIYFLPRTWGAAMAMQAQAPGLTIIPVAYYKAGGIVDPVVQIVGIFSVVALCICEVA